MNLRLSKITLAALLIVAASTNEAMAKTYKGVYKGEVAAPVPCVVPCVLKDGLYLGAQLGYDSYRVRQNYSISDALGGGATMTGSIDPALAANGWVGGLMLGYGQYLNDVFYLGAEAMGNYSDASTSYTNRFSLAGSIAYSADIRVRGTLGLAVLPGVRLNDTSLGYIRLGYNWTNMKINEVNEVLTLSRSNSKSETIHGFNYGVGIETLVYENWSVRGEFTHTNYGAFHTGTGSKFEPSNNQFMLGAIYHFGC